jgi:hypothetical protein
MKKFHCHIFPTLLLFNIFRHLKPWMSLLCKLLPWPYSRALWPNGHVREHAKLDSTSRNWAHRVCDESRIQLIYYASGFKTKCSHTFIFYHCMPLSYIPNHSCCQITQIFSIQISLISQRCMSKKISFPWMTFCFHQQLQLYWLSPTEDDLIFASTCITMSSFFSWPPSSDHTMSRFQSKSWSSSLWLHVWKEWHYKYIFH